MSMADAELESKLELLKSTLLRAGVKVTHQRLEIYRQVAQDPDHPDAEAIHRAVRRRLPTISLDTVYRTLWLLMDLGLITTLGPPRDRLRFDANRDDHHHFYCSRCGLARDVYCEEYDNLLLPDEVLALGRVEKTQVEFRGLCAHCAEEQTHRDPTPQERKGRK